MYRTDAMRTEFIVKKVLQYLSMSEADKVLHIGPGDGLFLELVHGRVKECHAVDPDHTAAEALSSRFRHRPNVLVQQATPMNLPFPSSYFSRIVFTECSRYVKNPLEMRRTLDEIRRIAADDAFIYISGVFLKEDEFESSGSRIRDIALRFLKRGSGRGGWRAWAQRILKLFPTVQRWSAEDAILYFYPEADFLLLCGQYALRGMAMRTELIHALSKARNDYVLQPVKQKEMLTAMDSTEAYKD